MVFNRITLAFPGNTEALFLEKYFSDSIIRFRVAFVLVTVLYALFGYLDLLIVPASAEMFHAIRYYFVVPLFSAVFFLSFTRYFSKIWQELLLICFIVGGSGISIMTMLEPENYSYYAGIMLTFSAGYFSLNCVSFMQRLQAGRHCCFLTWEICFLPILPVSFSSATISFLSALTWSVCLQPTTLNITPAGIFI
jgi:hypothetical protein